MRYTDRLVDTAPADGQLSTSETTLYTVPAQAQAASVQVTLSNTHAANTSTVTLFLQRSGGTSRRVFYAQLEAGDTAYITLSRLPEGTAVRGMATYAAQVDYWIADEQEHTL